jgi:hypothetical protein
MKNLQLKSDVTYLSLGQNYHHEVQVLPPRGKSKSKSRKRIGGGYKEPGCPINDVYYQKRRKSSRRSPDQLTSYIHPQDQDQDQVQIRNHSQPRQEIVHDISSVSSSSSSSSSSSQSNFLATINVLCQKEHERSMNLRQNDSLQISQLTQKLKDVQEELRQAQETIRLSASHNTHDHINNALNDDHQEFNPSFDSFEESGLGFATQESNC